MSDRESTPTAPRRSTRERKQTKGFENESRKRRRDNQSENESDEERDNAGMASDNSLSDDQEALDGVDYVAPKTATRGTRRGRGTGKSTVTRRRKANNGAEAGDADLKDGAKLAKDAKISDDNTIFNSILSPVSALQNTVDNFLEAFDDNPAKSLAELITCVLRACGCNSSVDSDQVMDTDGVVDALDEFTEGFKTETMPAYPIISKSPAFRKFRKSFAEFFARLVSNSAELGTLYSSDLIPILQAWIIPLSSSQIRSFRHTATMAALYIETGLCQVAASIDKELQTISRQREGERNKKAARNKARESELEAKSKEFNSRKTKLREYLKDNFNAVFVHRSRDHDANIRADCIHELGLWFIKHPSYFLESGFLPYLGKSLSDSSTGVRLEAVKAISSLYAKKDYIVALNHFTQTFKPRLIEIATADIDLPVRLNVIQALLAIDQLGLLEEEEREQLCLLIFAQEPRVRKAVAPFVQLSWSEEVDQAIETQTTSKQDAEQERQRTGAKCLANLLAKWLQSLDESSKKGATANGNAHAEPDSEDEVRRSQTEAMLLGNPNADVAKYDRIGLATEALWDEMEFLQKWNGLLNLLLIDHSTGAKSQGDNAGRSHVKGKKKQPSSKKGSQKPEDDSQLNDQEEDILLHVLIAAVRRATEEAKSRKKNDKATEADDESASMDDITLALIKGLPLLFIKSQTDVNRILNILVIPQLMNISMYLELRMTSAYETLWDDVSKQFMTHTNPKIIDRAVMTIGHMLSAKSLQNINKKKIRELEEELASSIRQHANTGKRKLESASLKEEEVQSLQFTTYRVKSLSSVRNLVGWLEDNDNGKETRLLDIFGGILQRAKLGHSNEDKLIELTISVLCTYLLWKSQITFSVDTASAEGHAAQQALKQQRDPVTETLLDLVIGENMQVTQGVKRAAFLAAMSIYLVYCYQSLERRKLAQTDLQMVMEEQLQFRLAGFIQAILEEHAQQVIEDIKLQDDSEVDGASKNTDDDLASSSDLRHLERDYLFHSTISPYIQAIHSGTISFLHSSVILAHYGRLGPVYDQLAKMLVEKNNAQWLSENDSIKAVIQRSMREAFSLRIHGDIDSEEPSVSLARLFSSRFVRGIHLPIPSRLPVTSLVEIHGHLIRYLVNKMKQAGDDEDTMAKITSLFRALIPLIPSGSPSQDMEEIKNLLEEALKTADIDVTGNEKHLEGLRAYERRLSKTQKGKATTKRSRRRNATMSDGDDMESAATDGERADPPIRTRPSYRRAAKDKSVSSAASSEVELDEDDYHTNKPAKSKKRTIQKAASEDEEEPDDQPVVLNGDESPPRKSQSLSPLKGSGRKRRRGSDAEDEPIESHHRENPQSEPEVDEDEDSFVGRRFKRIKR